MGRRQNFWKKAVVKTSTFVKNVEVQIRKNCFPAFPLGKVARTAVPARPVRADFLRSFVEVAGSAYTVEENPSYDFLQQLPNRLRQNTLALKREKSGSDFSCASRLNLQFGRSLVTEYRYERRYG